MKSQYKVPAPGNWLLPLIIFLLIAAGSKSYAQSMIGLGSGMSHSVLLTNSRISYQFSAINYPADSLQKKHSPKTAAIMSACLPGLGQIYNKKYWKLAIIYPALGGLGYSIGWNHHYYKYYRDALRVRYDDDATTIDPLVNYSDDYIVTLKNYYQRYRDLSVIGFAAVYILQVVDASVDAHLFYFDVGPDLSMQWSPQVIPGAAGPTYGVGFHLGFR